MAIRVTSKTKIDTSGFRKLKKEIERQHLEVGYLNSPVHWKSEGHGNITVAEVARQLHYTGWDEFMLSENNSEQVNSIIRYNLDTLFGKDITFKQLLEYIGNDLSEQMKQNIRDTTSPSISQEWAREKGFSKPLQHGSIIGESPNLLDEATYEIKPGRV